MDLRFTFNHEALLYDKARPHYPAELFDVLIKTTGITPGDRLLEIGPGTGQATEPLAAKGFRITAVELGEHLADVARHKLSHYPNVDVITGSFEETELPPHAYSLVFSATAFHWIDPEVRFTKTHQLLQPGGHLAIIHTNHVSDEQGDRFHHESQSIYDLYWPPGKDPHHLPIPNELTPPKLDEERFRLTLFRQFPLTIRYSAEEYIELLNTYSPTLSLPEEQRVSFLRDMRQLINQRFDGYHTKHFVMTLAIAQAI